MNKVVTIDRTNEKVGWHWHKWEWLENTHGTIITKYRYGEVRDCKSEGLYQCKVCGKKKFARPLSFDY